jgi:NADH-quinone oxidoreductase subunit N
MQAADLLSALPEVTLAIVGMALLLLGAFRGGDATRSVAWISVLAYVVLLFYVGNSTGLPVLAFNGLFVADNFAVFMKMLVLAAAAITVIMSLGYIEREKMARFEFPVLLLFATLGMLVMISANNLITLYIGLELQSLSLYVVAAFKRDTVRSSEAGLKYFVLGALSSGILLYGCSLVYGFAGTTAFAGLAKLFAAEPAVPVGVVIGLVFVIAGLAFKVSAVPFHMWTPDVYEGAPTPVTAFFAAAPKIAAMAMFLRVMIGPFGDLTAQWQQVIVFISIASMVLGSLAAIAQTNIKRLMAYSSIGHMGYALVGLAAGTEDGVRGVIIYLTIYLFMNLGTFACILCMRRRGRMVEGIDDLSGLSRSDPMMALAMAVFMFSMAGIPPLGGFFGKLFVFWAAISAGLNALAVIGVLASVVGAFYYLRIVKVMYFDEAVEPFDLPRERAMSWVIGGTAVVTTLFLLILAPVMDGAAAAAKALYLG